MVLDLDLSVLSEVTLPLLQWYWVACIVMVGSSLLVLVATGSNVELRTDPPGPKEDDVTPRFYQFRKKLHHYYLIGSLATAWIMWTMVRCLCLGRKVDGRLQKVLDFVATPKRESVDSTCMLIGLAVFLIHLLRRLYDTLRVSIFSRRQFLNPLELLLYMAVHIIMAVSLVADGPALGSNAGCVSLSQISWYHPVGLALFCWASLHHERAHRILAKLRRNKAGHIVTTGYKIPNGDWFELISCPQYLAEILIYVSIGILLGARSVTWWWVTAYVFTTQLYLAYNTHMWYQGKFTNYPKKRNMIFPYVL